MKSFYLWITSPTAAVEPALIAQLIHRGYVVSALSGDHKTTHWDNPLCTIIALKIEKDVEPVGEKRVPSVVKDDIMGVFKDLGAVMLSVIVAVEPVPDAAWGVGDVPKEVEVKVVPKDDVSPLLTEEPFG